MNICHPPAKSSAHLTKLFTVVIMALTLFSAPAMSDTNIFPTSGNVGIGTTTPANTLVIFNGISNAYINVTTTGNAQGTGFFFSAKDSGGTVQQWFFGLGSALGTAALEFRDLTSNTSPFTIVRSSGNVGIGTTAPTKKLDVNGDINVSGNINAKYQDVAEWVTATETMEPGTVVVLNPEKTNEVMPATHAYDSTVAGVVSANPGLTLGESAASKVPIATVGRVRVKVSATGQPIHVGDLLVTSGKSGLAMKSEPMEIRGRAFHQPGTILGKALEPLASGEGEILVLLSLQ